jgi:glycerate kinase
MTRARALACPASLKGVLSGRDAAVALAAGLREWSDVDELPVADGGEGTLDALHAALGGEWRTYDVHDAFSRPRRARALWHERDVVVEAAEVIPLDAERLDPINASSRGLGELLLALEAPTRSCSSASGDGERRRRRRHARGRDRAAGEDARGVRRRRAAARRCARLRRPEGRDAGAAARA